MNLLSKPTMQSLLHVHPRPWKLILNGPLTTICDANDNHVVSPTTPNVVRGIWELLPDFVKRGPTVEDYRGLFVQRIYSEKHRQNTRSVPEAVGRVFDVIDGKFLKVEFPCRCMVPGSEDPSEILYPEQVVVVSKDTFLDAVRPHIRNSDSWDDHRCKTRPLQDFIKK